LVVGIEPSSKGEYRRKLEEELKVLGIRDRVHFLPWQEHMGPIYEASDLIVLPSCEPESFGYVALEGMLAGKPVVASRIGGLCEVVRDGDTGFLVEPGNSDELALAMTRIAEDRDSASKLGRRGRERARTLFTMENNAAQVQEVYHRLLSGDPARRQSCVLGAESR
jgi:glycosyltransferase involved in cell wall biosynthesis